MHATLASAILDGHRVLGARYSPDDEEDFWQAWRRLGRLVGVRDRDLPKRWVDFPAYFSAVVEHELRDTETVHVVFETLARPIPPPGPSLPPALWERLGSLGRHVQLITAGLLPPVLRERLGLNWTATHDRAFRLLAATSGPAARSWSAHCASSARTTCVGGVRRSCAAKWRLRRGPPPRPNAGRRSGSGALALDGRDREGQHRCAAARVVLRVDHEQPPAARSPPWWGTGSWGW